MRTILGVLIALSIFAPATTSAAIAFTHFTKEIDFTNPQTVAITIAAGEVVTAGVYGENSGAVTCSIGGNSMTAVGPGNMTSDRVWLFYLLNPPTGSQTVTCNGTGARMNVYVSQYSGADQSSLDGTPASGSINAGSGSASITTASAGSWIVAAMTQSSGSVTGGTAFARDDPAVGFMWDSNSALSAGTNSISWTFSGGTPQAGYAAIALKVASAPASVPTVASTPWWSWW